MNRGYNFESYSESVIVPVEWLVACVLWLKMNCFLWTKRVGKLDRNEKLPRTRFST